MKKAMSFIILAVGMITVAGILFLAQPVNALKSGPSKGENPTMPENIQKIFTASCMDCHANDGNAMARSRVNFSEWTSYDAAKQADKANDICKELTKGKMPPKGFRKNHPELIPSQAEIDSICNWAQSLKK